MSQDQQSGRELFEQDLKQQESNPFDQDVQEKEKDDSNHKRKKKHKKDKHKKKKRHHEQEEQNSYDDGMGDLFQDQASQDDEDQSEIDGDAQILSDQLQRRRYQSEIYKRSGPRATDQYMNRIKDKNQNEINRFYSEKAIRRKQNEDMVPSKEGHQTYSINVRQGKQQELVLTILNKAAHYKRTKNQKFKVKLTSVMALKKRHPGKIFIQAANEKDIRQSLNGFVDVNLGKITKFQHQDYTNLFVAKEDQTVQFKQDSYIRIKKGLYQDDLGKIVRLKKSSANILLVPRINLQQISIKIKQQTSLMTDDKAIRQKKQQILKKYLNHRVYYPANLRPPKKLFDNDDPFVDFHDVPFIEKIKLQKGGLIQLSFRLDQLKKLTGSILPIEVHPFAQDGRIFQEMKDQKILTSINFSKGEEAQIVAGQLTGYFGNVVQIKQNTAVIKCRTKGMEGKLLQQPLDHLAKRFKQGQRVKVTSGTDKGKTGLILKLQGRYAQIWTDNQNNIKINKNNLELNMGELINQQNVHGLKKDDLIKTTRNIIGIVLATTKDSIKILDMNNTIQIITNLDFDSKLDSSRNLAKNRNGQPIKDQSIVRVKQGVHEGTRCVVKHVYKDFAFVFNEAFDRTNGISVQKTDNLAVLAKTTDGMRKIQAVQKNSNFNKDQKQSQRGQEEDFKVGKPITISSGPLKGYRGIIKSINQDRIEVRVPQKNTTEWITKGSVRGGSKDVFEVGKTPRRGPQNTQMYKSSPGHF